LDEDEEDEIEEIFDRNEDEDFLWFLLHCAFYQIFFSPPITIAGPYSLTNPKQRSLSV